MENLWLHLAEMSCQRVRGYHAPRLRGCVHLSEAQVERIATLGHTSMTEKVCHSLWSGRRSVW